MALNTFSLFLLSLFVCFLLRACDAIRVRENKAQDQDQLVSQKPDTDFCVANFLALPDKMHRFLDYGCKKYDCSAIQPNGPCYHPDNLLLHTSYVLDLDYRATGICNTEIGVKIEDDPSFGDCPMSTGILKVQED